MGSVAVYCPNSDQINFPSLYQTSLLPHCRLNFIKIPTVTFQIRSTIYPIVDISAKIKPFKIGVNFDGTEICTSQATNGCEWDAAITSPLDPSGTTGFKLQYWQVAC